MGIYVAYALEEFKGAGNLQVHLERRLMDKRIFPAINHSRRVPPCPPPETRIARAKPALDHRDVILLDVTDEVGSESMA